MIGYMIVWLALGMVAFAIKDPYPRERRLWWIWSTILVVLAALAEGLADAGG